MNYSNIEKVMIDTLIDDYVELANGDICTPQFFEENRGWLYEQGLILENSREWYDIDLMNFDMEE